MRATLALVGGFLGAGKTTLLLAAASLLRRDGRRVGLITNDQGSDLVDTGLLSAAGFRAEEVAGGCFCCRFSEFARSAGRLLEARPEVILAEPVGSCTDLAATVVRPLRAYYGDRFRVAPLTVLIDPARAAAAREEPLDYLFRKQIAEAEIIRYTKADLYAGKWAPSLSARTGEGVAAWLAEVLECESAAAPLAIDYARYAAAEASLGWLNWRAEVRLRKPATPAAVAGPLLERLARAVVGIAHLKVLVESPAGAVKAGICADGGTPEVDGALDAPPTRRHRVTVNLRASAAPETLAEAMARAAAEMPGRILVERSQAIRPAPPQPEVRL